MMIFCGNFESIKQIVNIITVLNITTNIFSKKNPLTLNSLAVPICPLKFILGSLSNSSNFVGSTKVGMAVVEMGNTEGNNVWAELDMPNEGDLVVEPIKGAALAEELIWSGTKALLN